MAQPAKSEEGSERRRRRAAASAAGAGGVAPVIPIGGAGAKVVAAAPSDAAKAAATTTIIGVLVSFLSAMRARNQAWLEAELGKSAAGKVGADDVAVVVADEMRREAEFAEGCVKRVTADLGRALSIPDADQRSRAVQGVLAREKQYARQRAEAMAARALAAVSRVSIKADSPQGAFWKLDPHVQEHTAGCLVMGGKFWPWVVLDRVHPPRHAGCPCKLKSFGEAVAAGDMRPGDVPNTTDALRQASGVVMEAEEVERLLAELELRDRLVESGMVSVEALSRIPLGSV